MFDVLILIFLVACSIGIGIYAVGAGPMLAKKYDDFVKRIMKRWKL